MRGISVKQAAASVGGKLSGKGDIERELRGLVIEGQRPARWRSAASAPTRAK